MSSILAFGISGKIATIFYKKTRNEMIINIRSSFNFFIYYLDTASFYKNFYAVLLLLPIDVSFLYAIL